jgi:hypothetical protein
MHRSVKVMRAVLTAVVVAAVPLTAAQTAHAQRTVELGVDAGAVFGLGDESSISITLPASRARAGFFQPGSPWSIEPALGLSFSKVEGSDGNLNYDLELGALYHLRPITLASGAEVIARVRAPYVRPFVGFTGFTAGEGDSEFSLGAGVGVKMPWRQALATRLEANLGYGFDNEALRIGVLAGLSFFSR